MSLQSYSQTIKETRRGSNAFPIGKVRRISHQEANQLKQHPELWPVLDVGCGLGYLVQACMENGIPCAGVDTDSRQLKYAITRMRRHGLTPDIYQADARRLPFENGSFGSIISWGMLMMVPFVLKELYNVVLSSKEIKTEVIKILSEMTRVVREGGEIRITTFSDKEPSESEYFKPTPQELKELGKRAGLLPVSVDYNKNNSTLISAFFRKP